METQEINTTKWIENLALEELHMEESGVVNFNSQLNPSFFLEESSIQLMNQIRERCDLYVSRFNELRSTHHNSAQIKTFKVSNTINDFMLFRNSLRLIISRKSIDVITIGFLTSSGQVFAPRVNQNTSISEGAHEIKAHVGAFNKITWNFMDEKIDVYIMVRHYLSEFVFSLSNGYNCHKRLHFIL